MRNAIALLLLVIASGAFAETTVFHDDQREIGPVVVSELVVSEGRLLFRAASGGCTDRASFVVDVEREAARAGVPHYRLTIRRVRADECKAFLPEGVVVEIDFETDLGLSGRFTVSVANPILLRDAAASDATGRGGADLPAAADGLRAALREATVTAIELEIDSFARKLEAAQTGAGDRDNAAAFRAQIEALRGERERFLRMADVDYPLPARPAGARESILDEATAYGPILPPQVREIVVTAEGPVAIGDLLQAEGATRSGPFYHLAGVDDAELQRGRYRLTAYLVYRREYFGVIGDYYVYATDLRPVER